jgi:NitT/TauT family transport system substrate-binding protein
MALLVISACAPAAAPPAPTKAPAAAPTPPPSKPKAPLKLKVANPHAGIPETGVALLADAMGYFKEEGLQVEFVFTKGGGDTVRAVETAGGADVGLLTGPMGILGAIEKGADIKIISAAVTPPDMYWVTTKDSPYKTIKDLEGKPVGFTRSGSSSNLVLLGILEKTGVKAKPVAAGGLAAQWTQVKTGQIAAGIMVPPDVWLRQEKEGARAVFRSTDYPEFAQYTYVVNFARSDSIKNKPEAIKAFLRGWKRAAELITKDPEKAAEAFLPKTETPKDLLVRYYKSLPPTKFRLAPIGGMDITIKYAKLFKFITKDPDLSKVIDLSLVPK